MADFVDDYLEQARQLLGTGHSPTPAAFPPGRPQPPPPDSWNGDAAQAAAELSTSLDVSHRQLHTVGAGTTQIISATAQIPLDGHRTLNAIQAEWNSDKNTLSPWANTAAGKAALLRAGQRRITETHSLISDIAARYGAAASAIRATQLGLPDSPDIAPAADGEDAANPDRRTPAALGAIDDPQSGTTSTKPMSALTAAPPPRPFTPPLSAMAPMANSALAPLTSSIPSAATALPSLASSAPAAMSPLLQPLSQIGTSSQTVLAATHLSPTDGDWSTSESSDDPRSSMRERIVAEARRALGLPYVWGGGGARGPSGGGFDCSGLTQFAVAQATDGRVILPRTTYGQIHWGQAVDLGHARPGDLVFSNFSRRGPEHVQIFAGRTEAGVPMVIEAQQTGVPVKFSQLSGPAVFRRVI